MTTATTTRTVYKYFNPDGTEYCEVVRVDKPDGDKGIFTLPAGLPGPHPAYRAERLAALPKENTMYVVEGEKCVRAVEEIGLTAVTSKGGSSAAHKTDWSPLERFQRVVILPDNDEPGAKYAQDVIGILNALPGSREVVVCELPGLEAGGDVVDFLGTLDWNDVIGTGAARVRLKAAVAEHGQAVTAGTVEADEWPEPPVSLLREIPEAEPYPVEALGSLAPVVEAIAEVTAVPPAMAAQSVLAAIALTVQKHGNVCIDGRVMPVSLFCMTVAGTGDRKSAVDAVALKPHREWMHDEMIYYRAAEAEYKIQMRAYNAALKKAENKKTRSEIETELQKVGDPPDKPLVPSLLIGNLTAEGLHKQVTEALPYCGVFSDEGGTLVGGYAMSKDQLLNTLADFSKLWDGAGQLRARAGSGLTSTFGKRVSMHLMCQPDVAARLYGKRIAHNQGFVPRLLTAWPETLRGTRTYQRVDLTNNKWVQEYNHRTRHILDQAAEYSDGRPDCLAPRNITLSPAAYELWVSFHDQVESQNAPSGPLDCISGWASKAAEHAARIAAVLSLFDDLNCERISDAHMKNGIALAEFYLSEMFRVHAQGEQDEEVLRADTLLRFMRGRTEETGGTFTSKFLLQYGPGAIRDAVVLQETLLLLQDMGAVSVVPGRGKKWRLL